jgi:DNA-binding transcriptional regulator YhcF (GntR family)
MNIVIDTESPLAVYLQIKNQIKGLINASELKEGTHLPSIRRLASLLGVAINTVARAYYELEEDKIIKLDGRRGTLVLGPNAIDTDERRTFLERLTEEYLLRSKEYQYSQDEIAEIIKEKFKEIY